ncbi:hypothetical protein SFRURICE_002883 [Spodoptera frugiperda]|nr:hypothetical protein SFRURICE_002883 [Spodoptera frugiperda]
MGRSNKYIKNGAALPSPCHCRRRSLGDCRRRPLGDSCRLANRTQLAVTDYAVPDAIRPQDIDVARFRPAIRHTEPVPRRHEDLVSCLGQELRYRDTRTLQFGLVVPDLVPDIHILHLNQNSVDQQHLSAASHLQCIHVTDNKLHLPLQTLKRIQSESLECPVVLCQS